MKAASLLTLFVLSALAAAPPAAAQKVVASTSWTAAFARAAGAGDVSVIAPMDLKHPPEYEIKPSDLDAVAGAALVVYAGYEKFAQRLAETSKGSSRPTLVIATDNAPGVIKAQARRIAEALGTVPLYERWAASFDTFAAGTRSRVQQAYPDRRAVVQAFQRQYVEWLGFEVVGVFGPEEPSPAVVLQLVQKKPALVIDNYHNPSGRAIAESLKVPYVALVNFPGKDGSRTFEDVYELNAKAFVSAAGR
jgi:zinc transport system substrate-binding protein